MWIWKRICSLYTPSRIQGKWGVPIDIWWGLPLYVSICTGLSATCTLAEHYTTIATSPCRNFDAITPGILLTGSMTYGENFGKMIAQLAHSVLCHLFNPLALLLWRGNMRGMPRKDRLRLSLYLETYWTILSDNRYTILCPPLPLPWACGGGPPACFAGAGVYP